MKELGPIAIIKDGDVVKTDIPARVLEVNLTRKEIKERLSKWTRPSAKVKSGVSKRYSLLASTSDKGAKVADEPKTSI